MKYISCDENQATHIRIMDTEDNQPYTLHGMTIGKVYPIEYSIDKFDVGEEMILGDNGIYICSFSLFLDIEYLKSI